MKKRSFLSVFLCALLIITALCGVTASAEPTYWYVTDISGNNIFIDFFNFEQLKEIVSEYKDDAEAGKNIYVSYSWDAPLIISEDISIPDRFILSTDHIDYTKDNIIINEGVHFEMTGESSRIRCKELVIDGTASIREINIEKKLTVNGTLYNYGLIELYGFDTPDYNHYVVPVEGKDNIYYQNSDCLVYDYRFVKNIDDIKSALNEAYSNTSKNWIYYIYSFDVDLVIDESLIFPPNTIFQTEFFEPKTITVEEGTMIVLDNSKWNVYAPVIMKGVVYNSNSELFIFHSIYNGYPEIAGTFDITENGYYLDNGTTRILSSKASSPFEVLTGVDSSLYSVETADSSFGTNWYLSHNCNHSLSDFETEIIEPDCDDKGYTEYTCAKCGESFKHDYKPATGIHTYDNKKDAYCNNCDFVRGLDVPSVPMYRMYDPNSGEHFYTGSTDERDFLVNAGWNYEGVGFNFPVAGRPVHRLYEPLTGEHLYTMDEDEKAKLLSEGWNYEGVAFNSGGDDEVAQYRLHNPNSTRGAYHFTGSEDERDILIAAGWEYQGIGFYSCKK